MIDVHDSGVSEYFEDYRSCQCLVVLQNTSLSALVSENFLQLNVVLKRNFPLVVEDKPAMTTQILLSNIGGAMSLWLGLTVMFFVDIIDLLICICRKPSHSGIDTPLVQKT